MVWLAFFKPVAINWAGNGSDAMATLLETGTLPGVPWPATVTVEPAGTVTLIPPRPTTGWKNNHEKITTCTYYEKEKVTFNNVQLIIVWQWNNHQLKDFMS